MCETCNLPTAPLRAPNRQPPICPQSQRSARDGGKLAVDGNRQNATGCSRAQRKLVPARARARQRPYVECAARNSSPARPRARARGATVHRRIEASLHRCPPAHTRGNGVPFPFSRYGLRPGCSRLDSLSIPPGLVNPAPTHVIPAKAGISRCAIRRVAWGYRPQTVMPRSNGTADSV